MFSITSQCLYTFLCFLQLKYKKKHEAQKLSCVFPLSLEMEKLLTNEKKKHTKYTQTTS